MATLLQLPQLQSSKTFVFFTVCLFADRFWNRRMLNVIVQQLQNCCDLDTKKEQKTYRQQRDVKRWHLIGCYTLV